MLLTPAEKDQLTHASNRAPMFVSPTTARRNGVENAGRADVRVPEPRTTVEALPGGLPFARVMVVFLQIGNGNIQSNQRPNLARCRHAASLGVRPSRQAKVRLPWVPSLRSAHDPPWPHDSAAALVRDDKLIAATEGERFRRVKHWAGFPSKAIAFGHVAVNQDSRAGRPSC